MRKRLLVLPLLLTSLAPHTESSELTTYIYNGTTATTDTFPSIASIYYDDDNGTYGLYCGATILDEQHVLTAAHCLHDGNGNLNESYLINTSIAIQLEDEDDYLNAEVIKASEFYVHSGYEDTSSSSDDSSWPNDIAIIKLADTINVDDSAYVTRATSDESDEYRQDDEPFVAVGHGYTEDGGNDTELLQTELTYEPASDCDLGDLNDSQLCMSGEEDEETGVRNSTCSGDSGGPLYWLNDDGNYVQAGITSYGWSGCYNSSSNDTGVFTEVADYEDWITSILDDDGSIEADYTISTEEEDDSDSDDSSDDSDSAEETIISPPEMIRREYPRFPWESDDSDDSTDSDDSDDSTDSDDSDDSTDSDDSDDSTDSDDSDDSTDSDDSDDSTDSDDSDDSTDSDDSDDDTDYSASLSIDADIDAGSTGTYVLLLLLACLAFRRNTAVRVNPLA